MANHSVPFTEETAIALYRSQDAYPVTLNQVANWFDISVWVVHQWMGRLGMRQGYDCAVVLGQPAEGQRSTPTVDLQITLDALKRLSTIK